MRSTMLDIDSRLRVATAVEQNETLASQSVFEILRRRGHPDAPLQRLQMAGVALMMQWSMSMGKYLIMVGEAVHQP